MRGRKAPPSRPPPGCRPALPRPGNWNWPEAQLCLIRILRWEAGQATPSPCGPARHHPSSSVPTDTVPWATPQLAAFPHIPSLPPSLTLGTHSHLSFALSSMLLETSTQLRGAAPFQVKIEGSVLGATLLGKKGQVETARPALP